MADFDKKQWLDNHVVPLLAGNPPLSIYHPFWCGIPPKDVLVLLMAGNATPPAAAKNGEPPPKAAFDPSAWPLAVKRLIDNNDFRFDFTREQIAITYEGGLFNAFGGDGAPLYNQEGLASARLYRKEADGIGLIVQVACRYIATAELDAGKHAAAATKAFYAQFKENPLEVCQKHGALFGQA